MVLPSPCTTSIATPSVSTVAIDKDIDDGAFDSFARRTTKTMANRQTVTGTDPVTMRGLYRFPPVEDEPMIGSLELPLCK